MDTLAPKLNGFLPGKMFLVEPMIKETIYVPMWPSPKPFYPLDWIRPKGGDIGDPTFIGEFD